MQIRMVFLRLVQNVRFGAFVGMRLSRKLFHNRKAKIANKSKYYSTKSIKSKSMKVMFQSYQKTASRSQ